MQLCYVSNLCVEAEHRRKGLARALLRGAERQAALWGCRTLALHCDCADEGNLRLYAAAGYRRVSLEPPWMPALQLRRVRLLLLARRVPPLADEGAAV